MRKIQILALLLAALSGSLSAQTPSGGYSSPATSGSSSGASVASLPGAPVSSGLVAQCPLTEGTGTTFSCGTAGTATLGTTNNAPLWLGGTQNPLVMDSFPGAAFDATKWTTIDGTFTVAGNAVSVSALGTLATIRYTPQLFPQGWTGGSAIEPTNDQYASVTIKTVPTGAVGIGPVCRLDALAPPNTDYYAFEFQGPGTNSFRIYKRFGGAFTNLGTVAGSAVVGDVLTIVCKGTNITGQKNGVTVAGPFSDVSQLRGLPGIGASGTSATSGTVGNFQAGSLQASISGGLLFGGNQFATLPASLNTAITLQVYACYQRNSNGNTINSPIQGNGNGAASNANGIHLTMDAAGDGSPLTYIQPRVELVGGSTYKTTQHGSLNGCGVASVVYGTSGTSFDRIYVNSTEGIYNQTFNGSSAGLQTVGAYQLGGAAAGSGFATASLFTGQIYYVLAYSRELLPTEIAQNVQFLNSAMAVRGVNQASGSTSNNTALSSCVIIGTSLENGFGLIAGQVWTDTLTFFNPTNGETYDNGGKCWNQGLSAGVFKYMQNTTPIDVDPYFQSNAARDIVIMGAPTNDLFFLDTPANALTYVANMARGIKLRTGAKVIVTSMVSRKLTAACNMDTTRDQFNPLLRQYWQTFADGFVDMAGSTLFADGTCTSNTFQADNTHISAHGQLNFYSPMFERSINMLYGNNDFSTATTYVAPALAAVATTAGAEVTNTATITFGATPANCLAGNIITLAGTTPAAYSGNFMILTRSATQITYFNPTSGLGVITVQGTGVCPQQQDQDVYQILNFGAGNYTLETCVGLTGQSIYLKNTNAVGSTIVPFGAETIDGAANLAIATLQTRILQSQLTSNTAGGCSWKVLQ